MAARQFHYAESLGQSTTTSASDQDKVQLDFTPDASATYFVLASWSEQINSATTDVRAKLVKTTATAATYQSNNQEAKEDNTPIDYISAGGVGIFTAGGSPGSETFKVQYSSESSDTAAIKDAAIIAIKANAADQSAEQTARTTTTSSSFVDRTTLTFTPATTGDYLLLVAADLDSPTAGIVASVQMTVDGAAYGITSVNQKDASNVYTWCFAKKVNLSNASHTVKIQFKSGFSSIAVGIANARIIAIRCDTLDAVQYDEFTTRETQSSTSYADSSASLTFTPSATNHLIIGSALHDGSATTQSAYARFIEGAGVLAEQFREPNNTADRYAFWCVRMEALAASSTTWKIQSHVESSGTTGLTDGSITVLQLGSAATNVTVNPSALTLASSLPAPTIKTGLKVSPSVLSVASSQPSPTVRVHKTVAVSAISLVSSLNTPTVSGKAAVTPSSLALASSLPAPSPSGKANVSPSALSLVTSGVSPAVRFPKTVSVAVLSVASSQPSAAVTGTAVVSPGAQDLISSLQTPAVRFPRVVAVAAHSLLSSVPSPTVSAVQNVTVTPGAMPLASSLPAVAVSIPKAVPLAPLTLGTSVPSPLPSGDSTISVAALAFALSQPAAVVRVHKTVSPGSLTLTASLPAPSVSTVGGVTVTPAAIAMALIQPIPTPATGTRVTVSPLSLVATQPSQTVSGSVGVTPEPLSLSAAVQAAAVTCPRTVTPEPVTLASAVESPTTSRNVRVLAVAITLAGEVQVPTLYSVAPVIVSVAPVTMTLAAQDPLPQVQVVVVRGQKSWDALLVTRREPRLTDRLPDDGPEPHGTLTAGWHRRRGGLS